MKFWTQWIFILIAIISIEADPNCTIFNNTEVVCTAADEAYVLKRGLVSHRNQTTRITLQNCRITDIDIEALDNLPVLTYLDLSMNNIQRLKLGVLDDAQQVTYLNLSYNMLTEFPLGLFDQKPNLEVLDLRGNMINNLELGVFDPLAKLKHLDCGNNALIGRNMNPYIFDESTKIKFLDFSGNNMEGSPDNLLHAFRELNFLNLDSCMLSEVPKFALVSNLMTMKHLMLSSNQISKLDNPTLFTKQESLEILNLAFNNIEVLHADVFKSMRKLKKIVLNNNEIKELPETLFQTMNKLNSINLSNNLIKFVPVNAFRNNGLKYLNLAGNKFSYLTDNFVLELKNSGAKLSKFFFNQNPWQCACLVQILNEVKNMKVEYNKVKFTGKYVVCVTKEEFSCKRQMSENDDFVELYENSKL